MANSSKRGRPAKPAEGRKGEYLDVRLTNSEKEAFCKAADLAGIPLSIWARERLRRMAARELQDANLSIPFLPNL